MVVTDGNSRAMTDAERQEKRREILREKKTRDSTIDSRIYSRATAQFEKLFVTQDYGHACSVCDRLWFRNDLHDARQNHRSVLSQIGLHEPLIKLCHTCTGSLG